MEGFQPDKFKMGWTHDADAMKKQYQRNHFLDEGSICLFFMYYPSELDAWGLKRDFEEEEKNLTVIRPDVPL